MISAWMKEFCIQVLVKEPVPVESKKAGSVEDTLLLLDMLKTMKNKDKEEEKVRFNMDHININVNISLHNSYIMEYLLLQTQSCLEPHLGSKSSRRY